jgi:Ca2+-binding EF-hand superfamily protein
MGQRHLACKFDLPESGFSSTIHLWARIPYRAAQRGIFRMAVPLFFLIALAGAAAPPAPAQPHRGRLFISPMGEPFRGSAQGQDGLPAWFQQADRDHDGRLTLAELQEDGQRFFLTLDVNHDGEIDPQEIERYENVVAPEIRVAGFGGMGDDESSGGGRLGLLTLPEPVSSADSNFNRGISVPEFDSAARSRFLLLDTNRDGILTLPELEAMRQAVRSNSRNPRRPKVKYEDRPLPDPRDYGGPSG